MNDEDEQLEESVAVDPEVGERAFQNLMRMLGTPAIARRQEKGELPKPLRLQKIQFVFHADHREPEVRVNDEVNAVAEITLNPGISKEEGDPITVEEVAGVERLALPADDEPDAAHATAVRWGDQWVFAFDFRYNKELAQQHLTVAKEFLEAAELAVANGYEHPAVDNLFSAIELTAKADLLQLPDAEFREKASHRAIQTRVNRFSVHGRIDPDRRDLFNKLAGLRDDARYLSGDIGVSPQDLDEFLKSVTEWIDDVTDATERL